MFWCCLSCWRSFWYAFSPGIMTELAELYECTDWLFGPSTQRSIALNERWLTILVVPLLLHIGQIGSSCDVDRALDGLLLRGIALSRLVEGCLDKFLPVKVVDKLLLRHEAPIHHLMVLLVLVESWLVHGLCDVVKLWLLLHLLNLALESWILR